MHRMLAVARAYTLGMLTYRTRTLVSLLSVLVAAIPVYFIAGALQPLASKAIASESTEYFTYLVVGSIASFVVAEAVSVIPSLVSGYITSGTLEQMLTTPIRWPSLLGGLSMYGFGWVAMRALVLLTMAWIWATSTIAWPRIVEFTAIMGLLAMAYVGVGLVAATMVLLVRSSLFIPQAVGTLSALLGTVYFPASVLPPAFAPFANMVPMTPALRAARQILLRDQPLSGLIPDIGLLAVWAIGGMLIGGACFHLALRNARRTGTLTQY
jgi:ABC-type polysaccharide/polyol phosphate export permease